MGSGDESNPSVLRDPLLPRPSSISYPDLEASPYPEADEEGYGPISYVHSPRPLRDLPALLLFAFLAAATYALGFTALARRNPDFPRAHSFVFDTASSSCVPSPRSPPLLSNRLSSPFLKYLISTLVVTLLLSGPLALALLWLLKTFAKQVIYASIPFFILTPIFLNIYWFVACELGSDCRESFPLMYRILVLVFIFVLIGIVVWIIVANWSRVELTIQIVRLAAAALAANLGLFALLPALGLALLAYLAPIVVFLVFARFNGKVVPRAGRDGGGYECEWKEEGWVPAYFALALVTMVWSVATMVEVQVYVISGTVAQWYFSKQESRPSRSMRSSLRNAFGPSFGTVCFSGMIFGAVRVVRSIVDGGKREDGALGMVNVIFQCCARFLLSAFDFVNKFTINFAAITGEGYCSAAKMTYELLKRNLLSAVFVETVSTRVLGGISFVLSALYAIVVCAILKAVSALDLEVYLVAVVAWLLLIVVLGYFVHVLDNVIDTVYVCYAIDRDKGDVSKQEVHEVYAQLPLSRNHRSRTPRNV